jgi:hypothetical protein
MDSNDTFSGILIAGVVILLTCIVLLAFIDAIVSPTKPEFCQEMEILNPDWEFHYDGTTGCRVLFRGFWIPADEMSGALSGGD